MQQARELPPRGSPTGAKDPSIHAAIDQAIESYNEEARTIEEKALKYIELQQAQEFAKQGTVKAAAIFTGQVRKAENGAIVPLGDPNAGKDSSVRNQATFNAAAIVINAIWVSSFGKELDPVLMYAIITLVQV